MSPEPSEQNAESSAAARLQERAPADQLTLKDRALDVAAEGITIADARLPDRPLIYANEGFEHMTGYPVAEVLGWNCRFLQGPGSDPTAVAEIRAAVAGQRECVVELLNYRRDGTTFWNRLSITPVRNDLGEVTHFIGIQSDVTARREAEHGLRRAKEALEHDLQLAARVQQALLPPVELQLGELRIARAFHPCTDLAGDAVGVVAFPHGQVGLYVLDVSGHGVGAALLSFTLNHMLSPSVEGALLIEETADGLSVVPPSRVAERARGGGVRRARPRWLAQLAFGSLMAARHRVLWSCRGSPRHQVLLPLGVGASCGDQRTARGPNQPGRRAGGPAGAHSYSRWCRPFSARRNTADESRRVARAGS